MTGASVSDEEVDGVRVISFRSADNPQVNAEVVRQYFAGDFFQQTSDTDRLLIDLSGVQNLDSAALGPLVQRLRSVQERDWRMALCGIQATALREVFSLTRFDQIFDIHRTRNEALQALQKA